MKALYDLGDKVAGFDFFNWLVQIKARGASEVVFRTDRVKDTKWPKATVLRRAESILFPGVALAGLPYSIGIAGEIEASPHTEALVAFCKEQFPPRLVSVLPPASERYTVTLRSTQRATNRNSLEDDWRVFAAEIGARVIEDYDVAPIHLHERMALYAGAEMNFFVTNGPAGLCSLSPYPMMMFDCDMAMPPPIRHGIVYGIPRYPWMVEGQHLIWERGRIEVLRRVFAQWKEGRL
jgi:hypothetical protein